MVSDTMSAGTCGPNNTISAGSLPADYVSDTISAVHADMVSNTISSGTPPTDMASNTISAETLYADIVSIYSHPPVIHPHSCNSNVLHARKFV